MNFLKKHLDHIIGLGAALVVAVLAVRVIMGFMISPGEEPSGLEEALGIEAAPVVQRAALHPLQLDWSFEGTFGQYDMKSLRRGLQVYREVCSACHGLKYIAFRNLVEIGYSEDQAKIIAGEYLITDGPDNFGDMFERSGRPSDYFPNPFPNENAAKASNGGKVPPDLSLITKAREDGPNYVYSLLVGYENPPADFIPNSEITNYNPYFEGWETVMPPPLFEGQIEYPDGTAASVEQMAVDVANFLMWTAEPNLTARHKMGFKFILYTLVLTIVLFLSMKKIWGRVKK